MFSDRAPNVAEMLKEIKTENASQLLNSIFYHNSPPGASGIPSLDEGLLSNMSSNDSPDIPLNRGDVIEIQGPAASGKTSLVYQLTLKCILPRVTLISAPNMDTPLNLDIGGWGKSAVLLDNDGRWDILILESLLTGHIEHRLRNYISGYELDRRTKELVKQSLERVHVFRPQSSTAVVATLLRLPLYHKQRMPSQEIALLCIDTISSFYWMDRYTLEQQTQSSGSTSTSKKHAFNPISRILFALQEIRLNFGPVIILTNWGLIPLTKKSAPSSDDQISADSVPLYRQHLYPYPAPFETPPRIIPNAHLMPPITHHITLIPETIDWNHFSLEDLLKALESDGTNKFLPKGPCINGMIRSVESGKIASFSFQPGKIYAT